MPSEKLWKITEWWGSVNNPFIVPTPKVYCPGQFNENKIDEDTRNKLLSSTQTLWHVINLLGISAVDAYERNYSLNEVSYDELMSIAWKNKRHDVMNILRIHGWSHHSEGKPLFDVEKD